MISFDFFSSFFKIETSRERKNKIRLWKLQLQFSNTEHMIYLRIYLACKQLGAPT